MKNEEVFLGGYSGALRYGLSDNFDYGGGILGHLDMDSVTILIGGVFWDTWIWTLTILIGGSILGHLDIDSLTILIMGGVFCKGSVHVVQYMCTIFYF